MACLKQSNVAPEMARGIRMTNRATSEKTSSAKWAPCDKQARWQKRLGILAL